MSLSKLVMSKLAIKCSWSSAGIFHFMGMFCCVISYNSELANYQGCCNCQVVTEIIGQLS